MRHISLPALALYWNTVRHLRPIQVYGRLLVQASRPRADLRPAPPQRKIPKKGAWTLPARRKPSLLSPTLFCFLNETRDLNQHGWNDPRLEKLWLYNLHYFDDLNALSATERNTWHTALLTRWVKENPPPRCKPAPSPERTNTDAANTQSVREKNLIQRPPFSEDFSHSLPCAGWEPYPTSQRILNWIKWELGGGQLTQECVDSLAVQTRWLMQTLEIHLLGNHLFANAKALVFAGLFFDGREAQHWLNKGLEILQREIPEQILSDGGQFERSTMYHALAFEDMLDLHNLFSIFANTLSRSAVKVAQEVKTRIPAMQHFFESMLHPDGEISFFNDAALAIAPQPSELLRYACDLGFATDAKIQTRLTHLAASGYLRIQQNESTSKSVGASHLVTQGSAFPMVALLDVAPLGPDYLLGHAHADTLSFELSLFGERVFVNSGTSCYGLGAERERQRGSAAHNTVVVDHQNSSEVWSGFRVARRAHPLRLEISDEEALRIRCAHDGYQRLRGSPEHTRQWIFESNSLTVEDWVRGAHQNAEARFHLHPNVTIETNSDTTSGRVQLQSGHTLLWQVHAGEVAVETTTYHPEFGRSLASRCLVLRLRSGHGKIQFMWNPLSLEISLAI